MWRQQIPVRIAVGAILWSLLGWVATLAILWTETPVLSSGAIKDVPQLAILISGFFGGVGVLMGLLLSIGGVRHHHSFAAVCGLLTVACGMVLFPANPIADGFGWLLRLVVTWRLHTGAVRAVGHM
jgi:hypothetical protein